MKTKIFSILLSAAAMAGFSACDNWNPEVEVSGNGQLRTASIGVDVDGAETIVTDNSAAKSKAAKAPASRAIIDLSDFIVTINNRNGNVVNQWTYTTMPELPVFPAGDYSVVVRSHEVELAAWNAPYYEGSQDFTIVTDKVTEVETVVCKLANIRVSVSFSEKLLKAFDNADEVTVKVTSEGSNSLVFTPAETRSGYFAALQNLETLRIDFSASILGNTETFTKTIDNVAKGQHRKIYFDLTNNPNLPPDEVGTITNDGQGITIDSTVVEDEPIESDYEWFEDNLDNSGRPGGEDFDDPEPDTPTPDQPADWAIEFTSETLNLVGTNNVADFGVGVKNAIVNIKSTKEFSGLNVRIESQMLTNEFLNSVGLAAEFDLANPPVLNIDGETKDITEGLQGLGFPVKEEVTGAGITELEFDITPFVGLIFEAGTHKFHITVTDKANHSKSMTLTLIKS